MYLKSLEVHGFKSFAKKIVFEFHNGITGIVGPNGSGKSNVGDAVRWVLGEQSAKQLRGSNMQDVIFSGTETRKPLGYAYVAITLDNSDHQLPIEYEEVKVARRVYRSGESEYLLNGTVCRLKDVQELFYDTGIGKEGYSLIGQGQIDKILSGKPEERRELFDEAAGIVKFKRRKKTAQKNLENERQNLVRINDILSELEKQVGPLKKQSETAKLYLSKKEELKKQDVNLFLLETDRTREQIGQVERNLNIAGAQLEETKQAYEASKLEYMKIDEATVTVEKQMEQMRQEISENLLNRQRLEGDINVLKEQISAASNMAAQFEDRKNAILRQIQEKEEGLVQQKEAQEELLQQLREMDATRLQMTQSLEAVQQSIQTYEQRMEESKNEIIRLLNEKAKIQSGLQRYDTMLEQIQIRKAELNQKLLQFKSVEEQQNAKIEHYTKELERITEEIAGLQQLAKEKENQEKELQLKIREINAAIQSNQENYHKDKSKLDQLINMTERYDGYGNAIKRVMEQKEKNPGLVGVVADIIKTNKKYETAIETALGGNIQNIVTDTEDTAKRMIEFLKENRYGRATFLPLTSMQTKSSIVKKEVVSEQGVIGIAHELVTTKELYMRLVENLLGRTVVVDTLNNAIALSRKYKYTLRIVTVDGELLNPGGSMTGGAFKNSSNLLGRRREIEEYQNRVERLLRSIEKNQSLLQEEKEKRTALSEETEKLKVELQNIFLQQNTAKINLKQAIAKKDDLMSDVHNLRGEGTEIDAQIQEISRQKQKINEEAVETQQKVEELERLTDQDQALLNEEREKEAEMSQEISSQQVLYASLEQKWTNEKENKQRVEEEILVLEQERNSLEAQFVDADKDTEDKRNSIEKMKAEYVQLGVSNEASQKALEEYNETKQKLMQENKSFFEKREELSKQEAELDKECFRLQSQKEKLEDAYETMMTYMWEEYQLSVASAMELKDENVGTVSELRKDINRLRGEIRNLGNVNVNAIEEYKEISERYEFMNTQRNDLLEAEKTLMDIIQELDDGMRKQFNEKFALIQKEFDKAYKELFGGGRGTIEIMTDEETDVLEAGITINSQPPGKKLGNMMQLSGGEKALTAIALLFAIQNLKPSPFCLLDEIEAALDDSNVDRYARYLNKLTKNTQFIIITHRRGTMAAADRLYGITMQEKGVSTLVSVNLIEQELDQ